MKSMHPALAIMVAPHRDGEPPKDEPGLSSDYGEEGDEGGDKKEGMDAACRRAIKAIHDDDPETLRECLQSFLNMHHAPHDEAEPDDGEEEGK